MNIIDKASDTLVLRPLISDNKQDIINTSQKIGTFHFASNMPEYCGMIANNPSAAAKLSDIMEAETKLSSNIVASALSGLETSYVKDLFYTSSAAKNNVEVASDLPEGAVLIDIREESKIKQTPLVGEHINTIQIPFFKINHEFASLDQNKQYYLYCEKGVLSELHALYLREKGFHNIKIFRPLET